MKKMILAACLITTAGFVACKKDSDDDKKTNSIVGKWEPVSLKMSSSDGDTTIAHDHIAGCDKDYLQFTVDSAFSYYHDDSCKIEDDRSAYTISGDSIVIKYMEDGILEEERAKISIGSTEMSISSIEIEDGDTLTMISTFKKI